MTNPTVTPITECLHDGGFLVSKAHGNLSIDKISVGGGAKVYAGTVLGQQTFGATSVAAKTGGNTGNGTATGIVAQANSIVGVYKAIVEIAGTNAATWNLYNPNGKLIDQKQYAGSGSAVVFADDQLHLTIIDGTVDFAVGDEFDITVAAGTGLYIPYNPSATDGSENASAILYGTVDSTNGTVSGAAVTRQAEVNVSELVWGAGVTTTPQQTAALAQLQLLGIVAR